jgi:DNA invertase Pin-like site-specific DNA recombinase
MSMTTDRDRQPRHARYKRGCTIAYLRVSTAEQTLSGAGLAAQRAAIEAYAERAGLTVDRWLTDAGVSGSVPPTERPALAEALNALASCKSGVLLVAKIDRLARRASDLLALRDLAERQRWALSAADGSIDTATPHGRAMATVLSAFAELERDLIRARTREGMAAKREAGVRLGAPVKLPQEVRDRIVGERSDGATFAAIAARLNVEGVQTARGGKWYPSTIKAVCTSVDHDAYAARAAREHLTD